MKFNPPKRFTKKVFDNKKKRPVSVELDLNEIIEKMYDSGSWQNTMWAVAIALDDWAGDYLSNPSPEEIKKAIELRDGLMKLMPIAKEIDQLFDEA